MCAKLLKNFQLKDFTIDCALASILVTKIIWVRMYYEDKNCEIKNRDEKKDFKNIMKQNHCYSFCYHDICNIGN
jgi:hypothetical protein